jgi:DNA-binding LytR/AlgR family response regulator
MNILICDDIKADADKLAEVLSDSGVDVNTTVFTDAKYALEHIRSGAAADVCFLDIVMPGMSGVELAEKLREEKYPGEIVFLTTSNDYAAESYQVKAFSYSIKPPSPDGIRKILRELESVKKNGGKAGIIVKSAGTKRFVAFRDISFIEVMGNNIFFRLKDGADIGTRGTLAEAARTLPEDKRFIQCHRSYIVSMDDIACVQGSEAFIMRTGKRVPVSKNYPDAVKQYISWVAGGKR